MTWTACFFLLGWVGAIGAVADEVVAEKIDEELIMAEGLNCPCKAEAEVPPPPPPPVVAAPRSDFYIGAGFGASMLHGCEGENCFDPTDNGGHDNITAHDPGFKVLTGYRFDDYLAAELAYYDLGQGLDDDDFPDEFDVVGGSLSGLVFLPIDERTRVFIRGGLFVSDIHEDEGSDNNEHDSTDLSGIFGVGGEFRAFSNFTFRGEVEYIPNLGNGEHPNGTGNIEALFASMSLIWTPTGLNPEKPFLPTGSGLSSRGGLYAGGGILSASHSGGEDRQEDDGQYFNDVIRDVEIGGKGFVGYRFLKYAAAEFAYNYWGVSADDDAEEDTFESQGLSLSVLGMLPVSDRTSAFVKVGGVYGWLDEVEDGDFPGSDDFNHIDEDGFSLLVGAGMNFDITKNVTIRGEVEWIPNVGDGTVGNADDNFDDSELGETADIDIIASSVNFIWWFR